jgi:hypothetical protein
MHLRGYLWYGIGGNTIQKSNISVYLDTDIGLYRNPHRGWLKYTVYSRSTVVCILVNIIFVTIFANFTAHEVHSCLTWLSLLVSKLIYQTGMEYIHPFLHVRTVDGVRAVSISFSYSFLVRILMLLLSNKYALRRYTNTISICRILSTERRVRKYIERLKSDFALHCR